MSDNTSATLQEAYELIEEGNLARAREILEPLSDSESSNPAFWWVYSHAIENEEEGRVALNKVVELDPTYPGATELKNSVAESTIQKDSQTDIQEWSDEDSFTEPAPAEIDLQSEAVNKSSSRARMVLVGLLMFIVAGVLLAIVSGLGGGATETTPTEVANNTQIPEAQIQTNITSTQDIVEPTITIEVAPTDEEPAEPTQLLEETDIPTIEPTVPPTEESTAIPVYSASLTSELSDFNVTEEDISVQDTLLGETLEIKICAQLGAESSIRLNETMDAFVSSHSQLPDTIQAVSVALTNCDDGSISRTIGVTRDTLKSVADGDIEVKDFQRMWQPLG